MSFQETKFETNEQKPYKTPLLHGCDNLQSTFERKFPIPGLQIEYSPSPEIGFLSSAFTSTVITRMLERKEHCAIYTVFPFLATFRQVL